MISDYFLCKYMKKNIFTYIPDGGKNEKLNINGLYYFVETKKKTTNNRSSDSTK